MLLPLPKTNHPLKYPYAIQIVLKCVILLSQLFFSSDSSPYQSPLISSLPLQTYDTMSPCIGLYIPLYRGETWTIIDTRDIYIYIYYVMCVCVHIYPRR